MADVDELEEERAPGDGPVRASVLAERGHDVMRVRTGIAEWDDALHGGAVLGSTLLLAGVPGAGKSTAALKIAVRIAKATAREALYVSAEMPETMVVQLARRAELDELEDLFVWETSVAGDVFAWVRKHAPACVVIDSVSVMQGGTLRELVKDAVDVTREVGAFTIAILHATKANDPAGPLALQHDVDGVAFMEPGRITLGKYRHGPSHRVIETSSDGVNITKE